MLKVRLMGTKNDIAWFQKILQRHPKIEVMELSELYSNKGTSKYYRAYAEIEKSAVYGIQRSPFCFRTAVFRNQRPPIF